LLFLFRGKLKPLPGAGFGVFGNAKLTLHST
jgi:hypothetical protein